MAPILMQDTSTATTQRTYFIYLVNQYTYCITRHTAQSPIFCLHKMYIKGKLSYYRPGEALGVQGGWGSQISRQLSNEGSKVVTPMHWPPLTPRKYSWYSLLLEAELTPGPQCGQKDYVNEKFQWHHQKLNPRPIGSRRSASTNCAITCPRI